MTRDTIRWASRALMVAASVAYAGCVGPGATTHFGFAVGVAGAPPPPPVVVAEPAVVPVDGGVYVVSEPSVQYDLFRYGATWYAYSGGYWYQARSYGGPFVAVDVRYVPRPVLMVPPRHWRNHPHGGPPGLARAHGGHED